MVTEDYVSFETAQLLKEKGFKCEPLHYYYDKYGNLLFSAWSVNLTKNEFGAPTLEMAIKWLRNEKGIAIIPIIDSILDNERFLWDIKIVVAKTNETYSQGWIYENPEGGYDRAIKYCLENLV